MYPPVVKKFLPSTLVNYLPGMGIAPLAKSLTEWKVLLAGRIRYYLTNWEFITQDQWILDAVQGFKIPFTSTLCQAYLPRGKPFSPEEEALLDKDSGDVTQTSHRGIPLPRAGFSLIGISNTKRKTVVRDQ